MLGANAQIHNKTGWRESFAVNEMVLDTCKPYFLKILLDILELYNLIYRKTLRMI